MRRLMAFENLENRCFLSVSAAATVGDTSFVEGVYTGEIRLTKADESGARNKTLSLTIESVDSETGQVQASIEGADLDGSGSGQFGKAPKWAKHLQLNIDTDSDATAGTTVVVVDAHFAKNSETQIDGWFRDDENKKLGKISLARSADVDNGNGGNNGGGTDTGLTDQQIVDAIASANQLEIQASQLAATQSQNAEVQAYAQDLINDHEAAETQLQTVATAAGVTISLEPLTAEDQAVLTSLQGLTGAEFDQAFAAAMITSHQQSIALHETAQNDADDAGLQTYLATQLPVLDAHLLEAQALQTALNEGGGGTVTDPGTDPGAQQPSIVGNYSGAVTFTSDSTGIGTTTGMEPGAGGGAITAMVSNAGQTLAGDLSVQSEAVLAGGTFSADTAGGAGPITTANGTVTISVASQSPEGTVAGTVSISGVGTYSFTGVYTGDSVSLVLTGTAAAPGTGTDPGIPTELSAASTAVTKSEVVTPTETFTVVNGIEHRGYPIPQF